MAYVCSNCLEEYGGRRRYRVCPNCGREGTVQAVDDREPGDDDGCSGYSDPRDERDERRFGE